MGSTQTKMNQRWNALNEHYQILEHVERDGLFRITADDMHAMKLIPEYSHIKFEPRLLVHFDNRNQQPDIFNDNGLSLLPDGLGEYVIGQFDPFRAVINGGSGDIPSYSSLPVVHIATDLDLYSAKLNNRLNESMGLNWAENTGVIDNFIGEHVYSTVAGRHKAGVWNYDIVSGDRTVTLSVNNPQIEVDGGYESESYLVLAEAKNSLVWEFCLRQLYYPFRTWKNRVTKPIRTVFVAIEGDEFYFLEYAFEDPNVFEASFVGGCHYIVGDTYITKDKVRKIHNNTQAEPEPDYVMFPQANTMPTVASVIEMMGETDGLDKQDIAERFGFHTRQSDYYRNAATYLGFAKRTSQHGVFELTDAGRDFNTKTKYGKRMALIEAMMRRGVFREAYELWDKYGEVPDTDTVVQIMKRYDLFESDQMYTRRAGSVRGWLHWLESLVV